MTAASTTLAWVALLFRDEDGSINLAKSFLVSMGIVFGLYLLFALIGGIVRAFDIGGSVPTNGESQAGAAPDKQASPSPVDQGVTEPRTSGKANGLAIASLVLGIFSLLSCGLFGVSAIVLGRLSRRLTQPGVPVPGRGMAIAGEILGWISTGLIVLFGLAVLALAVMAGTITGWKVAVAIPGLGLAGLLLWVAWDMHVMQRRHPLG